MDRLTEATPENFAQIAERIQRTVSVRKVGNPVSRIDRIQAMAQWLCDPENLDELPQLAESVAGYRLVRTQYNNACGADEKDQFTAPSRETLSFCDDVVSAMLRVRTDAQALVGDMNTALGTEEPQQGYSEGMKRALLGSGYKNVVGVR